MKIVSPTRVVDCRLQSPPAGTVIVFARGRTADELDPIEVPTAALPYRNPSRDRHLRTVAATDGLTDGLPFPIRLCSEP